VRAQRAGGIISYQVNALRLLKSKVGGHLRATPTKSEPPPSRLRKSPCPVLHCSHCHCCCRTAPVFPLPLPSFLCAVVLSPLVVSSFVFFAGPFLPFLPLRCCRSSPFLCRSFRVASACVLLHYKPVRAQLLRAAQDQTRSSLAPRSPLPSPLVNLPPSGEGAATNKAIILMSGPPALPSATTCRCFPLCR
jgi:hypothetical protein